MNNTANERTFSGCVKTTEAQKLVRTEPSHLRVSESPYPTLFIRIKTTEVATIKNERIYASIKHHHGKRNLFSFGWVKRDLFPVLEFLTRMV